MKNKIKLLVSTNPRLAMSASWVWMRIKGITALVHKLRNYPNVYFGESVKLIGSKSISIGINTSIGARSWLNVNNPQKEVCKLLIGDNCFIGQDNFFTVGRKITIGDYFLSAKSCCFIGSSHIYKDPLEPYLFTGTTDTDEIKIGANCFFGVGTTVIGNVSIGHGCVIGSNAEIRDNIPPYSLVVGHPAKVIKRFDFQKTAWVKWPTSEPYLEGPSEEEMIKTIKKTRGKYIPLPLSAATNMLSNTK